MYTVDSNIGCSNVIDVMYAGMNADNPNEEGTTICLTHVHDNCGLAAVHVVIATQHFDAVEAR